MPRKPIEFSLDFMIKDIFSRFVVKQFDDVSFNIKPLIQGKPYDTTNMTGKIFVGINNDMFMQDTNITVSSNNINVLLDRNMLQKQGRAYAEIELTDENGTITSSSFIFDIEPKIGEGATVPGNIEGFVQKYERLIAEFRTQINNAVMDSQTRTSNALAIFESNGNAVVNKIKTDGEKAISTFNTDANNKLTDVENRFQKLTTSQQQSAEVVDARDGEVSLKARLDRDLAKGKIIEEITEGNYITVKDTVDGSIKNIEVLGNTMQSASDLSDIQSVGELQEDGRYKMSILSCGKNLANPKNIINGYINASNVLEQNNSTRSIIVKIKPNSTVVISFNKAVPRAQVGMFDKIPSYGDVVRTTITPIGLGSNSYKIVNNTQYSHMVFYYVNSADDSYSIQLEEGTQQTTYEEYKCNKSSILLPCQLEKVGDVADRLFRREDGVWYIEKNVDSRILDGSEGGWSKRNDGDGVTTMSFHSQFSGIRPKSLVISDKFPLDRVSSTNGVEGVSIDNTTFLIEIQKNKLPSADLNGFKTWLMQNHLLIKYASASPQIIELPLDTQIQLNSYNGVTNLFTEDTVIEPTIKATIPKSLGASVQSLVNKTDILSDRVEAVEKLKEGTELEVSTDKGFVVCENSNNGQIEGLTVEGNTLVNFCKDLTQGGLSGTDGTPTVNSFRVRLTDYLAVKQNQTYTVLTFGDCAIRNYVLGDGETYLSSENILTQSYVINTLNNTSMNVAFYRKSSDVTAITPSECKVIILEGDHTQNPPSYFEGLKSVGDGVDKIEVLSRKEDGNLFDNPLTYNNWYYDCPWGNGQSAIKKVSYSTANMTPRIEALPNTKYYFKTIEGNRAIINFFKDGNADSLPYNGVGFSNGTTQGSFTTDIDCRFIEMYVGSGVTPTKVILTKNTTTDIDEFKLNKKQILYQTKEGNYEKPILRSTGTVSDSIEKHSDGKYYFHKRCGEVMFDGSSDESWVVQSLGSVDTYLGVYLNSAISDAKVFQLVVCNNIPSVNLGASGYAGDNIFISTTGKININIQKTKLSSQDLAGFKIWLQSNPITVVYELATEEVYEVLNLDLDSYEGETSLIFDGGAIFPKISFKIASHIANTISVLKDRVRYLEEKVIGMFKAVLAGDVQTLAYELYPEDFPQEDNQQATLEEPPIVDETIEGTELL